MFNRWLVLPAGKITIQWINHSETNCAIQRIVTYPVDSVIHLLNNWGLEMFGNVTLQTWGIVSFHQSHTRLLCSNFLSSSWHDLKQCFVNSASFGRPAQGPFFFTHWMDIYTMTRFPEKTKNIITLLVLTSAGHVSTVSWSCHVTL